VASTLPTSSVSDPIVTDNATVIVKVLERQDPAPSDIASAKTTLKAELLNERRTRFYASYMNKARERMKVNVNRELLAQLVA
jgi:parvulin-like peptidyl-prolyl isomerase